MSIPGNQPRMTPRIPVLLVFFLLALALAAGCTMPPAGGGGTLTPTPTPATTLPGPGVTVPPGPVVTVPPAYEVIIQVTRDPNTAFPYINFAFRGGKGQFILQKSRSPFSGQMARSSSRSSPNPAGTSTPWAIPCGLWGRPGPTRSRWW